MTVESAIQKSGPFLVVGASGTFPRGFLAVDPSHIRVIRVRDGVESDLLTGVSHTGIGTATGTVTVTAGIVAGDQVYLLRAVPNVQRSDYSTQGIVPTDQVERDLDLAEMQIQDLAERQDRSLTLPMSSDLTGAEMVEKFLAADRMVERAEAAAQITLENANYTLPDFAALLASVANFPIGATIMTRAEGFSFVAVLSGADIYTAAGIGLRAVRSQGIRLTPQQFGAVGDGLIDDTAAWTAFQAASGQKQVPPGRYLVGGTVKRFDKGALGNGQFDDSLGYWTQVNGDLNRDTMIMDARTLNLGSSQLASPAIKTQTVVNYSDMNPAGNNFTRVVGEYHEAIGQGDYALSTDNNNNFTVLAATAHNKFAGMVGMTAITGRVWDARESEVPNINTYGSSKSCAGYFPFTRRSRFANGGYMIGLETFCQNIADETADIPYQNNDFLQFAEGSGWTVGYHCTALGGGSVQKGAPITAGILIDGYSAARHGFWNGLIVGGSSMKINGEFGVSGTVGINLGSWASAGSYGDIGIKFGAANRHIYAKAGLKVRSSLTRFLHETSDCGVQVEAASGQLPFIKLASGANGSGSPDTTEIAALYGSAGATYLRSTPAGSEVRLAPNNGSLYYFANSARFAPSTDAANALGAASNRWSTVYASTGTINTSDARMKQDVAAIPDEVLDAWAAVGWSQYRFRDAVAEKGEGARLHAGTIAQDVIAAFAAAGLDASAYGLLCHDTWEAQEEVTETIRVEVTPEQVDDEGTVLAPAEYRDEVTIVTPARAAGDRYSIRYEEALCMEAAYQRRRADLAAARFEAMEARIAALEQGGVA